MNRLNLELNQILLNILKKKLKGYNFKVYLKNGYHSGGAGYTFSREALHKLGEAMHKNRSFCKPESSNEDLEIGKCLAKIGIIPGDSRDKFGRERFHPIYLSEMWNVKIDWMLNYAMYELKNVSKN
jgi:glycoprotein-N-acetylgalactosamine 3-beta-galactosyltransferase